MNKIKELFQKINLDPCACDQIIGSLEQIAKEIQ